MGLTKTAYSRKTAREIFSGIQHRGVDAFGFMYCDQNGKIWEYSAPGLVTKEKFQLPKKVDWFVGHVRFATHGSITNNQNNHPIQHDSILGVHNGVIYNYAELLKESGGRYDAKTEVDSEAIFALIQHDGIKGLSKLSGSAAIAWCDLSEPRKLHIGRTDGSPLALAYGPGMAFASEVGALKMFKTAYVDGREYFTQQIAPYRAKSRNIPRPPKPKVTRSYWTDWDAYGYRPKNESKPRVTACYWCKSIPCECPTSSDYCPLCQWSYANCQCDAKASGIAGMTDAQFAKWENDLGDWH